LKHDIENKYTNVKNLDELFNIYNDSLKDTKWKTIKQGIYSRYIRKPLGTRKVDSIKPLHINKIINNMDKQKLSPRTQKSILEILKPMFKFAIDNKLLKENPSSSINVTIPNQKKIVTNATEIFGLVYQGISTYYKNEPYYQALFLFGFTGRRIGEVLTLKWENIDFTNNYYLIEDTKNNDKQKYPLPPYIKEQLDKIADNRIGIVFKSPITGKPLTSIDRQMRQLIKYLALTYCENNPLYQAYTMLKTRDKTNTYIQALKWNDKLSEDIKVVLSKYDGKKTNYVFENLIKEQFDKLSPHYMRNILVSMLAEQHTEAIVLSGVLCHKDVNTINKYLSINYFKSGKEGLSKIDEIIDIEVNN
jgi:integrase